MKAQLDVRGLAAKRADAGHQPDLQERGQQGDLQRPGSAVLLERVYSRFERVETCAHGRQQFDAFLGDLHAAAVAAKQGHLNVSLQALDLLADRRRRDVERLGGRGEIQMRGHSLEHAQGSERHSTIRSRHQGFLSRSINLTGVSLMNAIQFVKLRARKSAAASSTRNQVACRRKPWISLGITSSSNGM